MSLPSESDTPDNIASPSGQPEPDVDPIDEASDSDLSEIYAGANHYGSPSPSPPSSPESGVAEEDLEPEEEEEEEDDDDADAAADDDDEQQLVDGLEDSDDSADGNASDDNFDLGQDAAAAAEQTDESADESLDSPREDGRAPKRRKGAAEDEYIQANPQLYGLRRSSRAAIQQRRVIDSDSDQESDSDRIPTRKPAKRRCPDMSRSSSKRGTPVMHTPAADSDSDTYGGGRARSSAKAGRRAKKSLQQPAAILYQPKRWSNRRAAQAVQEGGYQESDIDDEDDDGTPAYTVEDVVDDSPYIERVLLHRVRGGMDLTDDLDRDDFDYYIKWRGMSHLHNTWHAHDEIKDFRGARKAENYYRKIIENEIRIQFDHDVTPESREQYLIDREREAEAMEEYTKVERVVAVRDGEYDPEYFVKWKGLNYDECTWEEAAAIGAEFQDKMDEFLNRPQSCVSDRRESNPDTRSKMKFLDKQPEYIKFGELRSFQLRGLNFLCLNWTRSNNVILADEMGLGKTVQTVSFLSWLRNDRDQQGPFLVVAPLSVISAWADTFSNWTPDLNYVVYIGNEAARNIIRENELLVGGNVKKPRFNVLITTYEYILADADFLRTIKWQALAVDEAHRLKNRDSQLYAKLFSFGVPCKMLITGTPIQNNLSELAALLDFLNPGKVTIDEDIETMSGEDAQKKLSRLHDVIFPYILRRTKETVESDLPPKTEKIIRVELADIQVEYYKNILTRNYAALCDATNGHKNSLLNIMMELKKVSNHAYMLDGVEDRVLAGSVRREDQIKGLITSSGKMMLLDQLLTKLKRDGHRVLIFSQMVNMLHILGDYMSFRGYKFQRLDGTVGAAQRRKAMEHFNAPDSEDFCFLLSTRAGGLGINLMTADTVVIFDSDWNPQADLQAMARAHRIGQKKPVNIYRLVSKETVEEEVLERARNKLLLEYLTIQAGVADDGDAFREEFTKKGLKVDGPTSSDDIQAILKMRSQKMFEQTGNQARLEQLDIESILENAEVTKTKLDDKINLSTGGIDWDNFMQYTDVKVDDLTLEWDQIIPAEHLAMVQQEEDERKTRECIERIEAESAPRRAAAVATKSGSRSGKDGINNSGGHRSSKKNSERAGRAAKKREREEQQRREDAEARAKKADPRRELTEKETRHLIRAFNRYGDMDDRGDELVREARLQDRDRDFLKAILDDYVRQAREAVDVNDQLLAEEERRTGKMPAKKDRKAVMFDFGDVKKVNAGTAVERPAQLRGLRQLLRAHQADFRTFRLPEAKKSPAYSVQWGAREDAMLLVGIDRHGWGAWAQIRDDDELALGDKFFLEENQNKKKEERSKDDKASSPGAIHLTRRADFLLSTILARHNNSTAPSSQPSRAKSHHKSHMSNNKSSTEPLKSAKTPHKARPTGLATTKTHKSEVQARNHKATPPLVNGSRRAKMGDSARDSPAPQAAKTGGQQQQQHNHHQNQNQHHQHQNHHNHQARGSDHHQHHHQQHHRRRDSFDDRDGTHRADAKRKRTAPDDDRSPKYRRVDEMRRPSPRHSGDERDSSRADKRKRERRDDDGPSGGNKRRDSRDRDRRQSMAVEQQRRWQDCIRRFDRLCDRAGAAVDDRGRASSADVKPDRDADVWFLMKPIWPNVRTILSTTIERVPGKKDRAHIFGDELFKIGVFSDQFWSTRAEGARGARYPERFWQILAEIWPVATNVELSGDRLNSMYRGIQEKRRKEAEQVGRDGRGEGSTLHSSSNINGVGVGVGVAITATATATATSGR